MQIFTSTQYHKKILTNWKAKEMGEGTGKHTGKNLTSNFNTASIYAEKSSKC